MMVKLFVWSVLLYAFETWCLTAEDILRLQAIKCGYGEEYSENKMDRSRIQ